LFNHLYNLIKRFQLAINRKLKLIEYSTGSYIKTAVFNKNSEKPSYHSHIVEDNSLSIDKYSNSNTIVNRRFNYFYKFKTESFETYIPLAYNKSFHGDISKYDLTKEHYVKLTEKGTLNIGLAYEGEELSFKENGKVLGIDLNVRDNFCTIYDGINIKEIDYDRKYINEFIEELERIDKLSMKEKQLECNKKRLNKLVRRNEWYFKFLIGDMVRGWGDEGVTDVVMENLELYKTSASYVKNREFNIKYSRLVRLLRLSNIKEWIKRKCEDYGIKVHLTPAYYSSQECCECHVIEKNNRQGALYKCNCGNELHSDHNSPKNLRCRIVVEELRKDKANCFALLESARQPYIQTKFVYGYV